MKTSQVLAAAAATFPLAVMATTGIQSTVTATAPTDTGIISTVTATIPDLTGTVTATFPSIVSGTNSPSSGSDGYKELGCYQISPAKVEDNRLAPDERPYGYSGSNVFNTKGACAHDLCKTFKYSATQGNNCFCADEIDSTLTHITDAKAIEEVCNLACPGYAAETCGGKTGLSIYENEDPSMYYQAPGTGSFAPTGYTGTYTGSTNSTATKSGSVPVTSKTGGPVEAGASALVGQSVTMILAVCGVGATLFL
ncbi:hypothetical protein V8F33_003224 [Rhypophila sp. PSN 637]